MVSGAADSKQAETADASSLTVNTFHVLGMPIASQKTEGPTTVLEFSLT